MLEFPAAKDTDAEDVVWGLQTADTLWKRGERIDALVWLRRAAQAAGDANDDDRALELARFAAELTELVANMPGPADAGEEVPVEIDLVSEPPSAPTGGAGVQLDDAAHAGEAALHHEEADGRPSAMSVLPAEKVHAGMFDPWAEQPPRPPEASAAAPSSIDDDDVVTSLRPETLSRPDRAEALVVAEAPPARPPAVAKPAPPSAPSTSPRPPAVSAKPPLPKPPPLPPRARPPLPKPPGSNPAVSPQQPAAPTLAPPAPPVVESPPTLAPASPQPAAPPASPVVESPPTLAPPSSPPAAPPASPAVESPPTLAPASPPAAPPASPAVESPPTLAPPSSPPAAPPASAGAPAVDLDSVEAFADLPDDVRAAFANAATLHTLAEGEEVGAFALAYVIAGTFDVAATVVDAPAVRLSSGAVLRARGTTDDGVPMRLICAAQEGVVATWSNASVTDAFRTCPWVEDDLRASADRVQVLVGITIGPLGERLDRGIREQIVERLTMRPLAPGEVVVRRGEPVPGLLLVGVGSLELVADEDEVTGAVGSGDFLFPTEVIGAGAAPATARAGRGGALVMFGDRSVAQELLVTCPPLLEVFAGM